MLVVDNRWSGQNGIGRYAHEVISRLTVPWTAIEPSGRPSSATDFLFKDIRVGGKRPDAMYTPGYNGFLRAVPQTITVLDLIHLESARSAKYKPYYEGFLKPLIRRNGHVLTISQTSKEHIENWLNDSRVDVINAGMGSSPEFVVEGDAYSYEKTYYIYVGNLRSHKNVETLLAAMKLIRDSDLFIVCSDPRGVAALVERFNVADRVKVFSGVNDLDLARLYRGARATVQPSLVEGFGLPALESALCGTPVVFYEGCESVREICAGGGVSVSDALGVNEWAEAMVSIRENDRFDPNLIRAANYSWDLVGNAVSTILSDHRFSV